MSSSSFSLLQPAQSSPRYPIRSHAAAAAPSPERDELYTNLQEIFKQTVRDRTLNPPNHEMFPSSPLRLARSYRSPAKSPMGTLARSAAITPPQVGAHSSLMFTGPSDGVNQAGSRISPPKRPLASKDLHPSKKQHSGGPQVDTESDDPFIPKSLDALFAMEVTPEECLSQPDSTAAAASSSSSSASSSSSPPEISELLLQLETQALPEKFNSHNILDLLQEIDGLVFNYRKNEQIKEILFKPSFFLRLCEIKSRIDTSGASAGGVRCEYRVIMNIINSGLAFMNIEQKKELLSALTKDQVAPNPIYSFLSELCFSKYYTSVDSEHPVKALPSNRHVIERIIQDCETELANQTIQKVIAIAKSELNIINSGLPLEIERFFHFTDKPVNVVSILKNGIQVRHEKLYKGAFVSSNLETSYGKFGVTVAAKELIGKQVNRVERQYEEDQGSIFIGTSDPITPLQDRIIYTPAATDEDLATMRAELIKENLSHIELVSSDVQNAYLRLLRKQGWAIPIDPKTLTPTRIKLKRRGNEK